MEFLLTVPTIAAAGEGNDDRNDGHAPTRDLPGNNHCTLGGNVVGATTSWDALLFGAAYLAILWDHGE